MENDYISYIDTDSLFIKLNQFLEDKGIDMDKWANLPQDIKVKMLIKLSKCIENVVNHRSYEEIQRGDYNSYVDQDDFGIVFKQEIICSNILHLGPKMYAFHTINDEGWDCDKIDAKGIEIVRSTSPKVFRSALKELLEHLLKGKDDDFLASRVEEHRKDFFSAIPEDVSVNTGVNKLADYIHDDFTYKVGTPYHVKGVANYHFLLQTLGLNNRYESISEGDKCKVVYLKKNKYGIQVLTYYKWPNEFKESGIIVDYETMIEKYFMQKAHILLDPINRQRILEDKSTMDMFF
jgi:DNA polymerase elongation subunit (family B)